MPQNFNPRSHEGSDGHGTASLRRQHNFNPRSHEGSDITGMANVRHQKAFQSALPRGERHHTPRGVSGNAHFNPRSREGSDIDWVSNPLCNAISIRTPARGATRTWTRLPRLCRFQSALPRGERRMRKTMQSRTQNFNPRSREGSDVEIKACDYAHAIFQSALPRGERHGASVEYKPTMTTISIRAPARGATYNLRYIYFSRIFQSALPRGERRVDTNLAFHMFLFQSALPRGERLNPVSIPLFTA